MVLEYFTSGMNACAARSKRGATALRPAGFVTTVAESSGAAIDAPPIEFWTGPNPIMRMPFVAAAGAAMASAAATAAMRGKAFLIRSSGG